MSDDDFLQFAKEDGEADGSNATKRYWDILIVDDDADVHESTKFALRNTSILDRYLRFTHAYSAAQAIGKIQKEDSAFAVILLDVVMEDELAGLNLVKTIREDLQISDTRIILRTGQPGYAPETEAIRQYDINDYKNKSELTQTRLYTALTAAIRSYSQIAALAASKQGLETIVKASSELMSLHGFREFAAGIIRQITAILDIAGDGIVCFRKESFSHDPEINKHKFTVIAASGRFGDNVRLPLDEINDTRMREILQEAILQSSHQFRKDATALYFSNDSGDDMLVYLEIQRPLDETETQLLEVFSANIAICMDNVVMVNHLHQYAYYDPMLGIPNRLYFSNKIDTAIKDNRLSQRVVILDIDQFSELNDTLGSSYGDILLQLVAERLILHFEKRATVARIGGDQFGVLGDAEIVSPTVIKSLFITPFDLEGNRQALSVTQGFISLEASAASASNAIKHASIALRRAKETLRGEWLEFTREMERATQERAKLLQSLRKAFDVKNLFLAYQPQIDLSNGKIIGLEALMRWRSDTGDLVPPDQFIPTAESSGLIVPLGEWAMAQAIHELASLNKEFNLEIRMGVNVSQVQFRHPGFIGNFATLLEKSGIAPSQIELEITESVTMLEPEKVKTTLNALKALGVNIAIDDFGTGFSSLSYLQDLQVDRLKIDRSFVAKLSGARKDISIPDMIIKLGQQFDLGVIAEGVETREQANILRSLGCDEAQGYLFARPLPAAPLEDWLAAHLNSYRRP